ncbi:MAG: hypothetical protein IT453_16655 [Planctomycetes bacterium]|nr:hypothetical protein [Planctomycetota bacterium]
MTMLWCWLAAFALTIAPQDKNAGRRDATADQGPPQVLNITCYPDRVVFDGVGEVATQNPLATALGRAGPGTRILVQSGDYPAFAIGYGKPSPWNAQTGGGNANSPVLIEGQGEVWIRAGKASDTIGISQAVPNGWFTFKNLKIACGYRAGIFFNADGGKSTHAGFRFWDCDVIGGWDHLTQTGQKSKWGVWGSGIAAFEFRGATRRALVQDVRWEHGFYLQNLKGDVLIENVDATRLGRTFCQITARSKEGPAGVGTVTIRNCKIADVGISSGDNYKGGSALTFAGRHRGDIVVEKNVFRAGFAPALRALTREGSPYGTSALVAWDRGAGEANGLLLLRDNDFEMAQGCGDRPLVSLGGCREIRMEGKNRFVSGGQQPALAIDPLDDDGNLANTLVGSLAVSNETVVRGRVMRRGEEIELRSLFARAR